MNEALDAILFCQREQTAVGTGRISHEVEFRWNLPLPKQRKRHDAYRRTLILVGKPKRGHDELAASQSQPLSAARLAGSPRSSGEK